MNQKKAILLVSFGTTHKDTRDRTISAIKQDVMEIFSDYRVYEAWTSNMIRKSVKQTEALEVLSVSQAMQQMKEDGITKVCIQPTHVINGLENDQMKQDATAFLHDFDTISFGTPLLTSRDDYVSVCEILKHEFQNIPKSEAIVLMGHGTSHYANSAYAALDYECKDLGMRNIFIGTVEGYPDLAAVMRQVKAFKPSMVHLAPFMIVAGDHAKNDLAGNENDSWNRIFIENGYKTSIILRGLGEYSSIRDLFIKHIKVAIDEKTK